MKKTLPKALWLDIRHEYQTTNTTCRALALKYGINRETVASRCKSEKWRYRRQLGETQLHHSPSQMGSASQNFNERFLFEAEQWLDRIEEAYTAEVKYDRIEAIQKLLPQWRSVVDGVKKTLEKPAPATKPFESFNLAVLLRNDLAESPRVTTVPDATALRS